MPSTENGDPPFIISEEAIITCTKSLAKDIGVIQALLAGMKTSVGCLNLDPIVGIRETYLGIDVNLRLRAPAACHAN